MRRSTSRTCSSPDTVRHRPARHRRSRASGRCAVRSLGGISSRSVTDARGGRGIMRAATIVLTACVFAVPLTAQNPAPGVSDRDTTAKAAAAPIPKEASSVTDHAIRIGGQLVAYRATAATMLLKNDKDEAIGSLYYTAYTRTGAGDPSQRSIAFIYNGGPGSASAWLHMGAFGPRRIVTTDAGPTPPPPYQVVDNPSSLIDVTDMVFIDPIGTGFSKPVGKGTGKDFGGVDEDAKALAQFISQYVRRNGRWASPKYLIGERSEEHTSELQ